MSLSSKNKKYGKLQLNKRKITTLEIQQLEIQQQLRKPPRKKSDQEIEFPRSQEGIPPINELFVCLFKCVFVCLLSALLIFGLLHPNRAQRKVQMILRSAENETANRNLLGVLGFITYVLFSTENNFVAILK